MVPVIAVHGGADSKNPAQERGMRAALEAGYRALADGRPALDAVCNAVTVLEDDPAFNAGKGAARTAAGTIELDAAVMRGDDRAAGAVSVLRRFPNPVLVARSILHWSPHVMLAGSGADEYALEQGFTPVGDWYFGRPTLAAAGTVGAVALDADGAVAAATSTGGVSTQSRGRVGATPLIGVGTYADERCAISATGDGEAFIRSVFAHSVATRVEAGATLDEACAAALAEVGTLGGRGGCIAVTASGDVSARFTADTMPHGWAGADGVTVVL